ncbi:ion channel [Glaciecola petra]|uniref:Ion channel n=1 Tax=Glaciecola petra TaxID=3075602 RepID=A0ABU2ZPJ0_9ALTE|nr:ion channel [Aestuariibacter sp. P117]MDT0594537.1 ion channel [Aestuariibacter sp. P117]
MLEQLLIGGVTIAVTVVIQVVFIGLLVKGLSACGQMLSRPPHTVKFICSLVFIVLWLFLGLSASSWAWGFLFLLLGAFETMEPALYFSIVTFTTLGYGDITLPGEWRILGSIAAVNGLIIVGLNTAFLVEAITRIRNGQTTKLHK